MNRGQPHQNEVNHLLASIEEDTGIDLNCLNNRKEIVEKINQYVKDKRKQIKLIEEKKKTIISDLLKEKQLIVKQKPVHRSRPVKCFKKKYTKTASKISSDLTCDKNKIREIETNELQSQSTSTLDKTSGKTASDIKLRRKVNNRVRKRKSRKSLKSGSDLEIKPPDSSQEILKHVAEAGQDQQPQKNITLTYDRILQGLESSYCLRDWREIFVAKPENFNFYDFVNGSTYKKLVKLTNKTVRIILCRFHSIYFPDCLHMSSDMISVDFKNEVKLYPGLSFQFIITFSPKHIENDFKVEMIFVANINNYMAFVPIPVKGVLTESVIEVNPLTVDFGLKPVWMVKDKTKKYRKEIVVSCTGRRPIEMFVKKCEMSYNFKPKIISESSINSLQDKMSTKSNQSESDICGLESESAPYADMTESFKNVREILDDCVNLATDAFYFEKRHVILLPNTPKKIYLWFKNAKNLGFHQDKVDLEFFKYSNRSVDNKSLEFFTKKRILLFSETYELPLVITPLTLDLTTARKRQGFIFKTFTINNTHKNLSAYVEVVEPKLKNHHISIKPDKLFIQPTKIQKIKISYSATNKSGDTDLRDSVMNVSVQILARIACDKYADAPPLNIQIYAPYIV